MATDIRIWNGTAWQSIQGPPGPTVVSADAGNAARLGTDGRIYTPTVTPGISQAAADARYVEVAGDTMTGTLNMNPGANITIQSGVVQGALPGREYEFVAYRQLATDLSGFLSSGTPASGTAALYIATYGTAMAGATFGVPDAGSSGIKADGSPLTIGTLGSFDVIAGTANIERMRIGANGRTLFTGGDSFTLGVRTGTGGPVFVGARTADPIPDLAFYAANGVTLAVIDSTGSLGLGTIVPSAEAARARLVCAGKDMGGPAVSAASNLAESNTKATVSIRGNPYGVYSLAIGSESAGSSHYIQGVQFAGGVASAPVSINPYGGGIGIGCVPTVAGVEAEIGGDLLIRGAVNCTGNITSNGTAHAFAANSIPGSAVNLSAATIPAASVGPRSVIPYSGNHTIVSTDIGRLLYLTGSGGTITVPTDSQAPSIPVGASVVVVAETSKGIAATAGATLFEGDRVGLGPSYALKQETTYTFYKIASNTWAIQ